VSEPEVINFRCVCFEREAEAGKKKPATAISKAASPAFDHEKEDVDKPTRPQICGRVGTFAVRHLKRCGQATSMFAGTTLTSCTINSAPITSPLGLVARSGVMWHCIVLPVSYGRWTG
jgi:hypothetical protein